MASLQEDGALTNPELLSGCGGAGKTSRQFGFSKWLGGDVVDTRVVLVGFESVLLEALFFVQAGPDLAVGWDVLAWILCCVSVHVWM